MSRHRNTGPGTFHSLHILHVKEGVKKKTHDLPPNTTVAETVGGLQTHLCRLFTWARGYPE